MKSIVLWILCLVLSLSLIACTPLVKTDLKSFNANPEEFKGKRVVVTTDLRSLAEKPEDYLGKDIEVTGYVRLKGLRGPYWGFALEDEEGRSVTCYEWNYRVDSWIMPSMAIRQASRENEQVTVVGRVERDLEIELDWIEYQNQHYDTDYEPYRLPTMSGGWYGLRW